MSQKLQGNNFEWIEDTSQFNEDFMKNYNEEKVKKLVANLHDKTELCYTRKKLNQALNHTLFFKKFHRVIKFN